MGTILALGLAAAVYPQLLAVVALILTRPNPKPLLWACYLGAVCVSAGCAAAVLVIFGDRGSIAGTSSHRLGAAPYLIAGTVAVGVAVFAATRRGRRVRRRRERGVSRAERALETGSIPVAAAAGAILGIPGPFDVLALGHMTRSGDAPVVLAAMTAAFLAVKFLLIELPIAGYTISADGTAARVDRYSAWTSAHKVAVIAGVLGVIGLALIARGVSRLS